MKKQVITTSLLVALGLFIAGFAASQSIKLNPIKPGVKALVQISDEQQAILAVRTAKASVVSIVGQTPLDPLANSAALAAGLPQQSVAGTGFVLSSDGLIATNYHVIEPEGVEFTVTFADGSSYPATIVGRDKFDDIGLLKILATGLIPAKLGDSDALETGQTVFAIGNSLGRYQNSVTRGVVSGLSRAIDENVGTLTNHNWIQTDAAINVGNSGGPLINMAGEVVGMNTLIDLSGQSLGFAIPVNTIKSVVDQIKTFGSVSKPFLGISFTTINKNLATVKKLPVSSGALVLTVGPGSAADLAGLKTNDIVSQVNGQKLDAVHTLDSEIQKYMAGQQVTLQVLRNGQTISLTAILGNIK